MTPENALALLRLAESRGVGVPADGVDEAVTSVEKVDALHTIAGLEWEYSFQWLDIFGGWVQFTQWHKNLAVVEHAANLKAQNTTKGKTHLVRRLVSTPQPIGEHQ